MTIPLEVVCGFEIVYCDNFIRGGAFRRDPSTSVGVRDVLVILLCKIYQFPCLDNFFFVIYILDLSSLRFVEMEGSNMSTL